MGGIWTTSITNNTGGSGTITAYRSGNVVSISLKGVFNSLKTTSTTVGTVPQGFKPIDACYSEGALFTDTPKYRIGVASSTGDIVVLIRNLDNTNITTAQNVTIYTSISYMTND